MRLISCLKTALLGGVVFSLTACSYIADWFPDKQKQYRYTNELPDLEIPPDLTDLKSEGKGSDTPNSSRRSQNAQGKYSADKVSTDADNQTKPTQSDAASRAGKKHKPVKHNDSSVTLAENMENAALIEMQEPYEEAWNDVGRALGRLKIEVTDQNRSDGTYYVYYGGKIPKKNEEETSFWEDITSVLSSDKDQAKEYHIKLDDKEKVTNVYVLDQDGKGVSEGPGLELLRRLHKKLITLDQPDVPDSGKNESVDADTKPTPSDTASQPDKKHKPVKHNDSSMALAENSENTALIEMQEPFEEAWNDVGRALGRLKIEITDQNRSDGTYSIYYGGKTPKKNDEDSSFWDGITSTLSSDKDKTKEYQIKLEDKEQVIDMYVLDQDGKKVSKGPGLELLKRLHKKLIALDQPDVPDTGKEDAKPTEGTGKP